MKKGIIIGLVLFSVIGCMGQTQSGKEKIQELKAMGNQKEIYLAFYETDPWSDRNTGGLCQ